MHARFWGTRGSIARPGSKTLRYGGNTPCIEVRTSDGLILVIECGTGIHELGRSLVAAGGAPPRGHVLISHTHWDHIQGFPFFQPLYNRGSSWGIYAPGDAAGHVQSVLAQQMSYEYSPISFDGIDAEVRLEDLTEGTFDLGSARITTQYLNHPALALAYRIEADGATIVYASDHEPHSLFPMDAPPGAVPVHHEDRRHVRFLQGADLVIHDGQYTLDQFPERAGWGHTPVERAVDYAIAARAGQLALFHHDPGRDDDAVERLAGLGRARARLGEHEPKVFAAAEGQSIEFPTRPAQPRPPIEPRDSALLSRLPHHDARTVLMVEDDPDMALLMQTALKRERVRLLEAADGHRAIELAQQEHPCLILLDLNIPGLNGMEVCRTLRGDTDPRLRDVPILILTGSKLAERDVLEGFRAGATDYLTKPIKPTLLRTRVREWLLRTRPT
jgi:CheY-like chemotaxis protein/phosphoribosyl 1,2-cyclic phosphodiesterase